MTAEQIARELFHAVTPSRVTIRGSICEQDTIGQDTIGQDTIGQDTIGQDTIGQDTAVLRAEILAENVPSMTGAPRDEIPDAPTYRWLTEHRVPLLQHDCRLDPLPPRMLTEQFGVGAQMLGPLFSGRALIGTISVHQMGGPRSWTDSDLQALVRAVDRLRRLWRLDD